MRARTLIVFAVSSSYAALAGAEPETEIVVSGHKSTRPLAEPTLSASRIAAEELARPGASAAAVLRHVPGVQVSETGASSDLATASVRGATSAQTPVYLAGIRLNDDVTGTADLSLIPLWMLERADVYRGNAPADADHLGIGGAIYFEPRLPRVNRVRAGAQVGSFGERAGWLGAEIARRDDAALVAVRRAGARNDYSYRDDRGTVDPADDRSRARPNADSADWDLWAVGRTSLSRHGARLTTVFNALDREQGVSGLAAMPALRSRAHSTRLLAGLSAKVPCGSDPRCVITLGSQASSASLRLSDPDRELGLLAPRLDSHGTRFAESARVLLRGAVLRAVFGANVEFERLALSGATSLGATRSTLSGRVGLSAALTSQTEVSLLSRLTCDRTRGTEPARDCADLTPEGRLGLRQRWGAFELRTNLARYVRVPTLAELYGISAVVRGSSQLLPEQGFGWDLGARWEAPLGPVWAYLDAFGFARTVSNLIAFRRSSLGAVQPFNVGRARILGAELEAGAAYAEQLRVALALTLLDPRDTTAGRTLQNDLVPYQSRIQGSLLVGGSIDPELRPVRRVGLDARLGHRGSRLADPAGLLVLPASTVLDLGASLVFGRDSEISLRAALDDVFDARHFDFIGYPVPGRTWHLSCEAGF